MPGCRGATPRVTEQAPGVAQVAIMAAVTAALAQVAIPLPGTPVPFTLQVLGVLLSGLLLPPVRALQSQAVYVALGALGLPVFANFRGGPGVLVGPTGGYLLGFILAAWATAALAGRLLLPDRPPALRVVRALACTAAGVVCIYVPGVLQLAAVTGMPPVRALLAGAVPFIPLDVVKAVLAALAGLAIRRAVSPSAAPAQGPQAPAPRS